MIELKGKDSYVSAKGTKDLEKSRLF